MKLAFTVALLLFIGVAELGAQGRGRIELSQMLTQEIEVLLNEGLALHKSLADSNSRQAIKVSRRVVAQKRKVDRQLSQARNNRPHLEKILNSIQLNLDAAAGVELKNRDEHYRAAFEQFVQLIKVFKVTEYPIFFCSKNKAAWFQEDRRKARNPINPKLNMHCGQAVRI